VERNRVEGKRKMLGRIPCLAAIILVALIDHGSARTAYDNVRTPAGWAWHRIRNDQIADFADRVPTGKSAACGPLDSAKADPDDSCHSIPAQFVIDMLTIPRLRDHLGRHGLRLRNARIRGTIDLQDGEIPLEVWIDASRVEGDLLLADSHWKRLLSLEGTTVTGTLSGERMMSDSSVLLRQHAVFQQGVALSEARISGDLDMAASSFEKEVGGNRLDVEGTLFLNNHAKFGGNVNLVGAKIGNDVDADNSSFEGTLSLGSANIKSDVFLSDHATFNGDVDLNGVKIGGVLDASTSSFTKNVTASRLSTDGSLFLKGATFGGDLDLTGAKIGSNLEADGSTFGGALSLASSEIKNDVFLRNHATFSGEVNLVGAKIVGAFDASASSFAKNVNASRLSTDGSLFLKDGTFGGDVDLTGAKIGSSLEMDGSSFTGAVHLGSIEVKSDVFLRNHANFADEVILNGARISGALDGSESSFSKDVTASQFSTNGSLFFRNATFASDVDLTGARIGSNLEVDGATFHGALRLSSVEVKSDMFLRNHATFSGDVSLIGAKIGGQFDAEASSFGGALNLDSAEVKGGVLLNNHATFGGDVLLLGAKIGDDLEAQTSSFEGWLNLESVEVKSNVLLNDHATFGGDVDLVGAQIGGLLALDSAVAVSIDLSRAEIGELGLRGLRWWCVGRKLPAGVPLEAAKAGVEPNSTEWELGNSRWHEARCDSASPPVFTLRNAHAGALQDSTSAWPPMMDLEGFRYDRLGGLGGDGGNDMRQRSPDQWIDWIARVPVFSTQPYAQLSSVLAVAGHRDQSEDIQLAGRERERHEAHSWTSWAWLTFLSYVAGYGIGLYTFRVGWWVLGLTIFGAVILQLSPQARERNAVWRLGASLHRLLPVIELSKEFTDFFDGLPQQEIEPKLHKRILEAYFAGHAIAGYVLGFFLLAAMGGLTQKA